MRYIFLYLIFFFFSFITSLNAKTSDTLSLEYPSINYTTKDGLPSNETFCVFEDSRGYIWIGTDRGLVKYDGYEFKTYTTLDGLTDNVILALNEDDKGNIWYSGLNKVQLGYIDPQMRFHEYEFHQDIIQVIDSLKYSNIHFNEIYCKGNDTYLVNRSYGYIIINKNGIKEIKVKKVGALISDLKIFQNENIKFIYASYASFKNKNKIINIHNRRSKVSLYSFTKYTDMHLYPTLISSDSINYIYEGNDQLILNNTSIIHNKLPYLSSAFQISNNQYIFSIYDKSEENRILYYSNSPKINDPKIKIKNGLRASSAIKDSRGGIWISSLRKGVLYIPNFNNKTINLDEPLEVLYKVDSGLVLGNKIVNYFNPNGSDQINIVTPQLNNNWFNINRKFSFIGSILLKNSNANIINERFKQGVIAKEMQNIGDSLIYVWFSGCFSKIIDSNVYVSELWHKFNGELSFQTSFYCFKEDSCLFSTSRGLFIYLGDSIIDINDKEDRHIRHLEYLNKLDILVYSVLGEGLTIRYQNGNKLRLTTKDGLVSNTINSIYKDFNDNLWIGTNKGVNTVKIHKNGNVSIKTILNSSKNLSSPNILQLYTEDSILYLGTDTGYDIIDLKLHDNINKNEMPIHLEQIKVNDVLLKKTMNILELNYDSNNITYYYSAIAFNMYGNINYRYKLKGQFDDWIYTKERKASFMNILPGEYYFELEAQNEFGQWVGLNQPHHLFIKTPFWQTWWFISSVIFIIISLIGGILFYYISNLKKERSYLENERLLSEELNESRQKALSAQLNPHFVFNSLNSIQNFILTKRTELSSDYLGMFSKLMRFVFENSKKLYVPLSDEVEALHLYLELEQVRHNHQFEYVINIEERLNPRQVFMPSLLIQPIIENAIWHGLLHKQHGNKILEVSFKSKDELLVVEIKDNGVGRKKSIPKPKFIKKQKSSGVELTKQRLDLLSQSTGLKTSFKIIDLYDSHHTPNGTSVKISIPLNLS